MRRWHSAVPFLSIVALTLLFFEITVASENRFDDAGRLERIELGAGWLDMNATVKIPAKNWGKFYTVDKSKVVFAETNEKKHWQGRVGDGETVDVEITQTATVTPDGIRFDFVASAFKDSDMEGVIFWIDLPADIFAKGSFETKGKDGASGELPAELPAKSTLSSGTLEHVRLFNPDKSIRFDAHFDGPANATLQDSRKWDNHFSLLIHAHAGFMAQGATAKFGVVLSATGQPDRTPAEFKLDSATVRFAVRGLGGNYCFNLDTPEKNYTLAQLKPRFARTEISLAKWMPRKGSPPSPSARKLPREFETMRELARLKIPFIASVWEAPAWMTRTVERAGAPAEINIPAESFPAAAEAIGAYLLHAKNEFQAEPDYFSFNEPDYGAKIKFTAVEHRDAIKLLGAQFEKLGLKTKCVLGDVSNPRTPLDYLQPALDDAGAMKYVGALSFHSWGGGTPRQYAAWSDLAQIAKLPLIVAEAGVDPGAWKDGSFRSFDYFGREMLQYQDLFQFARPQAVLYWEYTGDYSLLTAGTKNGGVPAETERFALQKHWLRFVPPGSEALDTSGGLVRVQLTVFRKAEAHATHYTFQLSNADWMRKARIAGIPPTVKSLNVVQTSRGVLFKSFAPIAPVNGVVEIELPAQSMTTLTTME